MPDGLLLSGHPTFEPGEPAHLSTADPWSMLEVPARPSSAPVFDPDPSEASAASEGAGYGDVWCHRAPSAPLLDPKGVNLFAFRPDPNSLVSARPLSPGPAPLGGAHAAALAGTPPRRQSAGALRGEGGVQLQGRGSGEGSPSAPFSQLGLRGSPPRGGSAVGSAVGPPLHAAARGGAPVSLGGLAAAPRSDLAPRADLDRPARLTGPRRGRRPSAAASGGRACGGRLRQVADGTPLAGAAARGAAGLAAG
ncbi:unnamed protein product, partial [Prorocentrum cordatum]